MNKALAALALVALAGCTVNVPPGPSGRVQWSNYPNYYSGPPSSGVVNFGNANVNGGGAMCGGRTTLTAGVSTVTEPCFTHDAVVLCTDTSSAKPVRCTPGDGYLSVSGTGSDIVAWARVQ